MPEEPVAGYLTPKVMQLMSCCLLPVGLLILFYSIFVYNERVTALKQKEVRGCLAAWLFRPRCTAATIHHLNQSGP